MEKHVGIGTPCSEDRSNMIPTERGSFCNKCSMEVIDFTRMSTLEIKQILLKQQNERVCGRMTPELEATLNQEYLSWKSGDQAHMQRAMLFSLFLIFGLTLFSCSSIEDNKTLMQAHAKVQQSIQFSFGDDEKKEDQNKNDQTTITLQTTQTPPDSIVPIKKEDVLICLPEPEMTYDGGMAFTDDYARYLTETVPIQLEDSVSEVRVTEELANEFHAIVYPNPASDRTTLSIDFEEGVSWMNIQLVDMHGNLVEQQKKTHLSEGTFTHTFNVSHLKPGTYIVSVETEHHQKSIRFVKL